MNVLCRNIGTSWKGHPKVYHQHIIASGKENSIKRSWDQWSQCLASSIVTVGIKTEYYFSAVDDFNQNKASLKNLTYDDCLI